MSTWHTRTPLARARGLGSAKSGVAHWRRQRLTAVALVPLTVWFVISFTALLGADHRAYAAWIGHPLNAILMIALIAAMFDHMALGLCVIAEDYLHTDRAKFPAIAAIQLGCALLAIAGVVSILRMLT